MAARNWETDKEIEYFREYLRIPSVHPNPDYEPCVEFLKRQAEDLDLPVKVYYPLDKQNPVVVLTWEGTEKEWPSILLNSHMDVVPVFPEKWTHPPFGAEVDEEGRIFARGSQDMKCVGMQYLAAIRALKGKGLRFKRTIHISFVPDEEVGGRKGMMPFVSSEEFKSLNIGFSLDEGISSPTSEFPVFYAERTLKGVIFKISGSAGHGLLLMPNTAGEKLSYITSKMMEFRASQLKRLNDNPELQIGDVTTINLTIVDGGVQSNVVPPLLTAVFDVRLSLDLKVSDFYTFLVNLCEEAGGDIEFEFTSKRRNEHTAPTVTDESNPFWMTFKSATDELGLKTKLQVFPGGTDSRYIREVGIPALGFSPINNTPVLLHDHDEILRVETYLKGIEIYKKIIENLASVES
ncbi:aminoacylase-1 [Drosophila sechellia]|uniref:N-acyl-aliphatic-L-amino acid amidohydrolase n=1 Tax=Drosophila sechellia TaxID=7238 RepID=B4HIS4_DROSE|nr:aminoacylase-1 [Drosophila sechellia]EDW42721.1 GM26166 [Drosophila sechellia]